MISRNPRTRRGNGVLDVLPPKGAASGFRTPNAPRLGQLLHYGRDSGRDSDRVAVRRHHARRRLSAPRGVYGTRAFLTPTVILFGSVLF